MDDNGFQPQRVIGGLSSEGIRLQNDIVKKSLGLSIDSPAEANTTLQQNQPTEIETLRAEIAKLKVDRMTDSYDFNKNRISYDNVQRKPNEQVSPTMGSQVPSNTTSVQQQQQSVNTNEIDTNNSNNDLFSSLTDIFGGDTKPNVNNPVSTAEVQQANVQPDPILQQQEQNKREQGSPMLPPEVKGAIDNMNDFSDAFSKAALARGLNPDETLAKVNGMLTVDKMLDLYQGIGQSQPQQQQVQQNNIAPSLSNARETTGAIRVASDPNRVPRGMKKLLL